MSFVRGIWKFYKTERIARPGEKANPGDLSSLNDEEKSELSNKIEELKAQGSRWVK